MLRAEGGVMSENSGVNIDQSAQGDILHVKVTR